MTTELMGRGTFATCDPDPMPDPDRRVERRDEGISRKRQ